MASRYRSTIIYLNNRTHQRNWRASFYPVLNLWQIKISDCCQLPCFLMVRNVVTFGQHLARIILTIPVLNSSDFGMLPNTLLNFYTRMLESLTGWLTTWSRKSILMEAAEAMNTAWPIMGTDIPTIEKICRKHSLKKATNFMTDQWHPGQFLKVQDPKDDYLYSRINYSPQLSLSWTTLHNSQHNLHQHQTTTDFALLWLLFVFC